MRIGELRHKVELQSATQVTDNMGGFTATWATVDRVWAGVWPVSVLEQIRAASPTMVATHRVRIRYYVDLDPSWRIKYGSRYFSIVSIVNPDERNAMQDLLCKEVL